MTDEQSAGDLLRRLRAGDGAAAVEFVRRYEPEIRRAVRVRLTDPRLRRVLDSLDVCQSVLGNFFIRVAAGQLELDKPENLLRLLVTMAKNKVLDYARRQQAACRDQRRVAADDAGLDLIADPAPGPSQVVIGRELLEQVRRELTDDERELADQRALGRDWPEIATARGATPDALRKKLTRALDRVALRLGLEGSSHA